uniref:Global nitrogen transcriptional regulator n=1 Tax=Caloglossa beccarii TaxID=131038 RepID=A0A1Z1M8S2_9FLOR|nr:global nitrogen transcriptional regulator [Caloglossa beccarii]ARW62370.1 global nitrogen transcriptional regulator [Caloglossa beccarii]
MKWIHSLSKANINYHVYQLNKNDSILYFHTLTNNKYLIILEGIVCIFKIFNNKKKFAIGVLKKDHTITIDLSNQNKQYYYKLVAFDKTYIISFSLTFNINNYINPQILFYIIQSQKLTIKKYELFNCIFKQKYTKYKIIQFILFLFIEFGIISNKKIYISFDLSQEKLSLITGINKNTINHIIHILVNQKIIHFSYKKKIYIYDPYRVFSVYCY